MAAGSRKRARTARAGGGRRRRAGGKVAGKPAVAGRGRHTPEKGARARRPAAPATPFANRPLAVQEWIRAEIREQERRYRAIVKEMEALEPRRERWIAEFLQRIQTRGFNVHAQIMRRIKPEELYPRPKRRLKVVF